MTFMHGAFDKFFADGQKMEDRARCLVACTHFNQARYMFDQLGDLHTADRTNCMTRRIYYRSGAEIVVRAFPDLDSCNNAAGEPFSHMVIVGELPAAVEAKLRSYIRAPHGFKFTPDCITRL